MIHLRSVESSLTVMCDRSFRMHQKAVINATMSRKDVFGA